MHLRRCVGADCIASHSTPRKQLFRIKGTCPCRRAICSDTSYHDLSSVRMLELHVAGPWMRLMAWCCRPCCDASCRIMLFFRHHQFTTMVRSVLTNSSEHHRRATSEAKHDIRGSHHTWGGVKPSRYRFGACSTGITSNRSAAIPSTARMLVLMHHIC